jgi:hypothetical protein
MALRVAIVLVWSISWAAFGWWLFDPESGIVRGPTFWFDNRRAESTVTVTGLGALLGGLGGVAAITFRRYPWSALGLAVVVGVLVAGGAQVVHELRYPVYSALYESRDTRLSPWESGVRSGLRGGALGIAVGVLLMLIGELATRRERSQPQAEPNRALHTDPAT